MCELVSIESGANVRQNPSSLVDAPNVPTTDLETRVKGEEHEKVAVSAKCHVNMNTDARPQDVQVEGLVLRSHNILIMAWTKGQRAKYYPQITCNV